MKQKRPYESEGVKEMKMEVELIGITVPVPFSSTSNEYNSESVLATAGRTCYQSFDKQSEKSDANLVKHFCLFGHYSVLEHCSATFRIMGGSRTFTHQLVRHRHQGISQESQRYCDEGNFGYVIPRSIKAKGMTSMYSEVINDIRRAYVMLQKAGIKNEDARFLLPNAVCSEIVISPNFAELRHMFRLRLTTHAQWETRECFRQILEIMITYAPNVFKDIYEQYKEYGNLNNFK